MLIKPGQRILIVHAPAGYLDQMGLDQAQFASQSAKQADVVQVFVTSFEELHEAASKYKPRIAPGRKYLDHVSEGRRQTTGRDPP